MTPVKQQFIHDPENGSYGDCERAVIASLLDLPIDQVPHFADNANQNFWEDVQAFVASHGYIHVVMPGSAPPSAFGSAAEIFHEIAGPSPRYPSGDVWHAVVGRNGKVFFDPHPSGDGLVGDPEQWQFGFLVRAGATSKQSEN